MSCRALALSLHSSPAHTTVDVCLPQYVFPLDQVSLPLVKAVLESDLQDISDHLSNGLNPLDMDPDIGLSAIHAAALHGDDTLMSLILEQPSVCFRATAFSTTARSLPQTVPFVDWVVQVTPESLKNHTTAEGHSVLDIVLSHKNREVGAVQSPLFAL